MRTFFRLEGVPVHQNLLMPTPEEAEACDRADIVLGFCDSCGFISNLAFQPDLLKYSPSYENSQSFSPSFRSYMENLAADLIDRYDLRNKKIIEIGCGKGEFLAMLCDMGNNEGIGFDPSYVEAPGRAPTRATFIRDFYSERYACYHADLVCCRHVLEHVQRPGELVATVRRSAGDGADPVVFFEVPSVSWILRNRAFWDIFYEHCSYFSAGSLARLLGSAGMRVVSVREAFGGQYMWFEASAAASAHVADLDDIDSPEQLSASVEYFAAGYREKLELLRGQMEQALERKERWVIWGAGAKGVTFLNALDLRPSLVPYAVDINPRKQGGYIPGTAQRIVAPDFLKEYSPDVIMVMNPNYLAEIQEAVERMGISAEAIPL